MSTTAEKIVTDAMGLPPVLRAFVAEKLIESLDESAGLPLSAKWKEVSKEKTMTGIIGGHNAINGIGLPINCIVSQYCSA